MANDKNLARNIKSALSLLSLFKEIQLKPTDFLSRPNLLELLSSQIKMGKLDDPERFIFQSSMSTLKRAANKNLEGGFEALDNHRKLAHQSLLKALNLSSIGEDSKEGRRLRSRDSKAEVRTLRQEIFLRDGVIYKLFHLLSVCAKENPSSTRQNFFLKSGVQELHRLGFKGSNINER